MQTVSFFMDARIQSSVDSWQAINESRHDDVNVSAVVISDIGNRLALISRYDDSICQPRARTNQLSILHIIRLISSHLIFYWIALWNSRDIFIYALERIANGRLSV